MPRFVNDPHLVAIDNMRSLLTRIELELMEPFPNLQAIKRDARTIRVLCHQFAHIKDFVNVNSAR